MTQVRKWIDLTLSETAARQDWPPGWRGALSDDEWVLLTARADFKRFEAGDTQVAPEHLAKVIYDSRRAYLPPLARKLKGPSTERRGNRMRRLHHDAALSDVFLADLEHDARDSFQVAAFRKSVLADGLVSDAGRWIQKQVHQQGPPTVENGRARLVAFTVGDQVLHRATRVGYPLEWLRRISEALAAFYRWHPADAVAYVLTGAPPAVRSITAEVHRTWPMIARSTITLTIAPTATPSEVAAAYASARFGEFKRRIRRLTAKHAALAAFVFRRRAASNIEQMTTWNRTQRKSWRYRFPSVFRREADLALDSLLELDPHRNRR
jgi:hypothetical protein